MLTRTDAHSHEHPESLHGITLEHIVNPGEDVCIVENCVQVSGQVAVLAINGLLARIIFEESSPHWMIW